MTRTSWALISGASTGIGRATALRLAGQGFQVLAGVRSQSAADSLSGEGAKLTSPSSTPGRLIPVMLDVTDASSISAAIGRAGELAGSSGLRVVINNAGIVVPGPVEYVTAADWRRQFDVNFFGMIELTRAALPLLRQGVANHGAFVPRLLFISSIGGRVSQPILAPYTTSKFATSALGDSLRLELRRQGIGVTVIEPGAISTEIWGKGDVASEQFHPQHPARVLYGPEIDGLVKAAKRASARAIPADVAAKAIVRSVLAKRPPARVLVGRDAKIAAKLRNLLPLSWFDAILMREFNISSLPVTKPDAVESKLA
ncbi:MAG: SDR family NAD(P)-dependent oxidoreductase [Acidobacteriaceae bacterium]|nr:SDR family NAD(P)-dependent oxidoreductase [Acidobacteriaceae bacterium]